MKKHRLLALALAAVLAFPVSGITAEAANDYSGTNVITQLPGTDREFFSEDSTKEDWFNISGYAADGVQDRSQYYEEYVKAGKKDTRYYKVVEEDGYWKTGTSANKEYISKEAYEALDTAAKEGYRFVTAEEQFTIAITSGAKVIQVNAEELDLGYYYLLKNNIPLGGVTKVSDYEKGYQPQTNPCIMNKDDVDSINANKFTSQEFKNKSKELIADMEGAGVSEFSLNSHTTLFSTSGCRIRHCGISLNSCDDVVIRNFRFDGIYEWDDLYTNATTEQDYTTRKRYGWCYIAISGSNDIWVDHCTFGFAFDGNIDIKNGSSASLTWCQFGVQDISDNGENPATTNWQDSEGSELWKSILFMEEYYQKYKKGETDGWHFQLYTKYRDQGATPQEILRYAAMHSKVHLCGSGEDSFYTNVNEKITLAFNYYTNIIQRIPMIRQGNGHMYNCVVDNTEWQANVNAMKNKEVSGLYNGFISINNARDGATIGTDTCVFREVVPMCGKEYQGMDLGNVNAQWKDIVKPMVNHNLVVNSRVINSNGTDYTGSSWDNNGENPLTAGKWDWDDKASIGNFKWSLWANQDQFAGEISGKLDGVEGKLLSWAEENGADQYYKQFYIGSDDLGYSYKCFELDDVETMLSTYGGARKNVFDEDDVINYITPYTNDNLAQEYKTKVVIDVSGGTLDKLDNMYYLKAGESVTLPGEEDITRNGYVFKGWRKIESRAEDGSAIYGEADKNVTVQAGDSFETVYYVAKWDVLTYEVRFDSMGGSQIESKAVPFGSALSSVGGLPADPQREGFTFRGWYNYDPETRTYGTKVYDSTAIKSDITFYAKWRAAKVDIVFNSNGGSAVETINDAEYGKTITLPEAPAKNGATFLGWYYDKGLTKQFKETTKVTESLSPDINENGTLTLYAKWEGGSTVPEKVTLSFDTAGGTTQAAIEVTPGAAVGELPVSVKAEYVFTGWYGEAECTTASAFTTESSIEADTTVYAGWAKKGDVDGNGKIAAEDALMVLKRVANMLKPEDLTAIQEKQADVDGNDKIAAEDALMILKYVANMITGFDA